MNSQAEMRAYQRAGVIPQHSCTCSKAPGRMGHIGEVPLFVQGGDGAHLIGLDGERTIDMQCALGARSLNNDGDGVYSKPSTLEADAAHDLIDAVAPWASTVRFVKSGSESTTGALMVARLFTGRQHVMVADNSYHGWHPWFKFKGKPNSEGQWTLTYPYGDMTWAVPDDVAAIFVEPARWVKTPDGYMQWLLRQANDAGALLIADSMIYGARFALGGASEHFNFQPHMETFGKGIANGKSIAAIVGCDALAQYGHEVSGTFNGDTVGLKAVIETLREFRTKPVIQTLRRRGLQLQRGLGWIIRNRSDVVLEGEPVHQRLRFLDPEKGQRFADQMAKRGIDWHPEVVNLMFAHTVELIEWVVEMAHDSLVALDAHDAAAAESVKALR